VKRDICATCGQRHMKRDSMKGDSRREKRHMCDMWTETYVRHVERDSMKGDSRREKRHMATCGKRLYEN